MLYNTYMFNNKILYVLQCTWPIIYTPCCLLCWNVLAKMVCDWSMIHTSLCEWSVIHTSLYEWSMIHTSLCEWSMIHTSLYEWSMINTSSYDWSMIHTLSYDWRVTYLAVMIDDINKKSTNSSGNAGVRHI